MRAAWWWGAWVSALVAAGCASETAPGGSGGSQSASRARSHSATGPAARHRAAPKARRAARSAARSDLAPFDVDPTVALEPRWTVQEDRTWQRVTYRGSEGERIPALFRGARRPGRRPAVILGHGHGGDARSMARFFGSAFSRRVHVLAVNHPFHGHDRKVPGEDICPRDARKLVKRWIRAVRDLRHARRVLASRHDVDPRRIGYLGFSLGACLGALFVAHEPHIKAAVLVSPAANWSVLARTDSYWHIGWRKQPLGQWLADPALRARLRIIDPARTIARFAPRPLYVVVGSNDKVIRDASGLELYKAAGRGRKLWHHPGGHGLNRGGRRKVARWLEERLYE